MSCFLSSLLLHCFCSGVFSQRDDKQLQFRSPYQLEGLNAVVFVSGQMFILKTNTTCSTSLTLLATQWTVEVALDALVDMIMMIFIMI